MLTMYVKYQPPDKWKFCTWIWKTKECIKILFQIRIILSLKCLYFWQCITISEALLCKIRLLTYGHLAVPSGIGRFLSWHDILISPFFVWRLLVSKIWCLLQTTNVFIERVISSSSCIYILDWLSVFCLFLVHLVNYICIDLNAKLC